jgi:hypothetical protein
LEMTTEADLEAKHKSSVLTKRCRYRFVLSSGRRGDGYISY